MMNFGIKPCGDSAAMITIDSVEESTSWWTSHTLARVLLDLEDSPITDVGPTFDTVLIEYDPLRCSFATLKLIVSQAAKSLSAPDMRLAPGNTYRVPVLYGGDCGPDMGNAIDHTGLSTDEIIEQHTTSPLLIRCYGAPSGSPLSDGPNLSWDVPRHRTPRTKVPAGSVALAGKQSLIYSTPAPGGWQLIGRTPLVLVDLDAPRPVVYRPGDSIHYYPITEKEFHELQGGRLTDEHRVR